MVNTNGSLLMVHYMVNSMWINACYPPALAQLAGRPALRAKAHHAEIIDMGQNDHTRKSMEKYGKVWKMEMKMDAYLPSN